MEDCLKDLEYYSSKYHCYVIGEIIGIEDEDNYVMKNKKDSTEEVCESKNIRKITKISSTPLDEGICEYMKNDDEYLEVEIKEKKGLFYILEIEDENENQSTFLARQKQLRYIEYLPFDNYIEEKYANVRLPMQPTLSSWVGSERFNDTLKEINGDETGESETYKLFYTKYPSDSPNYLRIFCCSDKKDSIELVLSHSMKKEIELTSINKLKENSQKELEEAQKKNKTIFINPKYVGVLIGKEGSNIKKLNSKFGVTILVDNNTKKTDTKPIKVTISGDDGDKVEECAKEINYVEKIFEIPESSVGDLKKRSAKLIEKYKIKNLFVGEEEKKDDEGNVYKAPNVTIIGNSEFIDELYNNEIENYHSYNNSYDNNNYNYNSGTYKGGRRNNNNYYNNNYGQNYSQNSYKYNNNKNYGYYH
jgi:hypothetical protein